VGMAKSRITYVWSFAMPYPSPTISHLPCKRNELLMLLSGTSSRGSAKDYKISSLRRGSWPEEKVTINIRQVTDIDPRLPIMRSLRLQRDSPGRNVRSEELRNERTWEPVMDYTCRTNGLQGGYNGKCVT